MTCHACQGGAYLSQLTREGSVVTVKGPAPVVVCTASGIRINLGSHIHWMARYVYVCSLLVSAGGGGRARAGVPAGPSGSVRYGCSGHGQAVRIQGILWGGPAYHTLALLPPYAHRVVPWVGRGWVAGSRYYYGLSLPDKCPM